MVGKGLVKRLLRAAIAHESTFRRYCSESVCVFLYHDVTDKPSLFSQRCGLNVPPALFERQIAWINKFFHLLTPKELVSGDHPRPAAMISFDDGMPGYFENAIPLLEKNGTPSIIFLNMEAVSGQPFWAGLVTYLCEESAEFRRSISSRLSPEKGPAYLQVRPAWVDEFLNGSKKEDLLKRVEEFHGGFATKGHLEEASERPGVFFGNHLYNHFNAAVLTDSELREAYCKNREALKVYPNFEEIFSYPFGHPEFCYNERTNKTLFELGAKRIFSSFPSPNFEKGGRFLHRISLDDRVASESELFFRALLPLLKRTLGSTADRHHMV